jgi:WD40 repeat protein
MDSPANKKKSPVLLFSMCFIVIIGIMFIANIGNTIQPEFKVPREGFKKTYTVEDKLIAITLSSNLRVWNWDTHEKIDDLVLPGAKEHLYLPSNKLIYIPSNDRSKIKIMNPITKHQETSASSPYGQQYSMLTLSENSNYIASLLSPKKLDTNNHLGLTIISLVSSRIEYDTITIRDRVTYSNIYGIAISNDGNFAVFVGDKDDKAWLAIADVRKKNIVAEHTIENSIDFTCARFLKDNSLLYVGGEGLFVYCFDTQNGDLVKKLQMEQHSGGVFNEQRVTSIMTSPNGKLLAACLTPTSKVYIWNASDDMLLGYVKGSRGLTYISFSPDSSQYVISGNNYMGNLKICPCPEIPTN